MKAITHDLIELFQRDLSKLKEEIRLYATESTIWKIDKNIANAAGNLCLHLVGNLNTYIGSELGKTGYIRNRDQEFSLKNIPRQKLIDMIESTSRMIEQVLREIPDATLDEEYPLLVLNKKTTTRFFLIHLLAHLNYHLGQVNYHRRLIDIPAN
jgi:uncharacterized damage-inducible protein DinB